MPNVHFEQKAGKYGIVLSYTLEEIDELGKQGYFLEAFGRLDKMIDQACFGLLHKKFAQADALVTALVDDEFSGLSACKVLYNSGILTKELFDQIKSFKQTRNVITHDIYGHYALALRQAGEIKDESDLKKKADGKAKSALQGGQSAFSELMELFKR